MIAKVVGTHVRYMAQPRDSTSYLFSNHDIIFVTNVDILQQHLFSGFLESILAWRLNSRGVLLLQYGNDLSTSPALSLSSASSLYICMDIVSYQKPLVV